MSLCSNARKVALALAGSDGPWTRAAALAALGGSETVVLDFVRTGIAAAAAQDDRETLRTYADPATATGSEAMLKAAAAALAGSDADVSRFLRTRDYPERQVDDRIAVNQIIAAAKKAGNRTVVDRAQDALDDPTVRRSHRSSPRASTRLRPWTAGSRSTRSSRTRILALSSRMLRKRRLMGRQDCSPSSSRSAGTRPPSAIRTPSSTTPRYPACWHRQPGGVDRDTAGSRGPGDRRHGTR